MLLIYQLFPSHNHFSHLKFQPSAGRSHKSITGIHKHLILFLKDFLCGPLKSLYWVSYDIASVLFWSFGLESCEILVPQSGIHTPCTGRRSLNTWTTSEDSQAFKTPLLENSDSPGAHSSFPWNWLIRWETGTGTGWEPESSVGGPTDHLGQWLSNSATYWYHLGSPCPRILIDRHGPGHRAF